MSAEVMSVKVRRVIFDGKAGKSLIWVNAAVRGRE